MIGTTIERVYLRGFEVTSREKIFTNLAQQARPGRTNKASQTKIIRNKVSTQKARTKTVGSKTVKAAGAKKG